MSPTFFRSLCWGFNAPLMAREAAGSVLWWKVRSDFHLQILAELPFAQMNEDALAESIRSVDRTIPTLGEISYTVADPTLFPKKPKTYPGFIGTYISETLAFHGISLIPADDDELNGWKRVQSLLRLASNEESWLTISARCVQLIKALQSALSDDQTPDALASHSPSLVALRYGAMSQPSPDEVSARAVPPPVGSPLYYMQKRWQEQAKRGTQGRRFGETV